MLCIEELLTLEAFQQLPKEQLDWACDHATEVKLPAGATLSKEGDDPSGFYILLKGQISLTRLSEGVEMPIGQHTAPAFFGEIPVLTEAPVPVSVYTDRKSVG